MKKIFTLVLILILGMQTCLVSFAGTQSNDVNANLTYEELYIEGNLYNFEYDVTNTITKVKVSGEDKTELVVIDNITNKAYVNGKLAATVEVLPNKNIMVPSTSLDSYLMASRGGSWEELRSDDFSINFNAGLSIATVAAIVAVYSKIKAARLAGTLITIYSGVAIFCTFTETKYMQKRGSLTRIKYELEIFLDNHWGNKVSTIRYYDSI